MKKFIIPILLCILFIPFIVKAEVCDIDKISISSIDINNKTDTVNEVVEAISKGRNIILNLNMSAVGDNIEYKFVVKNDSNEDYELDKNSLVDNSEYIDFIVESEDNNYIVKANSTKTINLKVKYKNEVPDDAYSSGQYNYNQKISFNLSTEDKTVNPDTMIKVYVLVAILLLLIVFTLLFVFNKKKHAKALSVLIIGLIIIPTSVFAICKCDITIDSNIVISKNPEFCYTYNGETRYLEYQEGMTWSDYVESSFNKNYIQVYSNCVQPYGLSHDYYCYSSHLSGENFYDDSTTLIRSSDEGCYIFELPENAMCK